MSDVRAPHPMVVCGVLPPVDCRVDAPEEFPQPCRELLTVTDGPAGSLWCPVHGHVLDVLAQPPLTGVVHLNFGHVKENGWASIEAIEAGLV